MITGFRTEMAQDVGAMWEADAAAEWERLNADDENEDKYADAADEMNRAVWDISDALDRLARAADKVDGTVMYDRVVSLLDDLDNLQADIRSMRNGLNPRCYQ